MVPSDNPILELLREHGNLTPQAVENLGGPAASTAQNRLPELLKHGLVERVADSHGLYRITDRGRAYLNEELTTEDLEPTED